MRRRGRPSLKAGEVGMYVKEGSSSSWQATQSSCSPPGSVLPNRLFYWAAALHSLLIHFPPGFFPLATETP